MTVSNLPSRMNLQTMAPDPDTCPPTTVEASTEQHIGNLPGSPLVDRYECSCGWRSGTFYDGAQRAKMEWLEHSGQLAQQQAVADSNYWARAANQRVGQRYSQQQAAQPDLSQLASAQASDQFNNVRVWDLPDPTLHGAEKMRDEAVAALWKLLDRTSIEQIRCGVELAIERIEALDPVKVVG